MNETRHIPVLLQESIENLSVSLGDTIIDATFGGGGHTEELLKKVGPQGLVIAFDRDFSAIEKYRKHHTAPKNLILEHANYSEIKEVLLQRGITNVKGILADLGFSSDQIESESRGLSFLLDGPLDMRLDQSESVTASDLVRKEDVSGLARIFRMYGDEPQSLKIAKALVRARAEKEFSTTKELADFIQGISPRPKGKNIHPATKVFQALRIAVNQEREHLVRFLESASDILAPQGRLVVISFHSGEDKIVKNFFVAESKTCVCPREFPVCRCEQKARLEIKTKKGIKPSASEINLNPRARSAILRVAERV